MAQEGNPVPSYEALSRASCIISVLMVCYHIVKTGTGLGVFERHLPDITLLLIYLQKTRMITMTWKDQRWLPRGNFEYLWAPIQWWHLQTSDPGKDRKCWIYCVVHFAHPNLSYFIMFSAFPVVLLVFPISYLLVKFKSQVSWPGELRVICCTQSLYQVGFTGWDAHLLLFAVSVLACVS